MKEEKRENKELCFWRMHGCFSFILTVVVRREKIQRQEGYSEFKVVSTGHRFSEWETGKDEERQIDR